jgi:hypothetical protein
MATLSKMRLSHAVEHVYVAAEHAAEVSGVAALRSFTKHLWQMQK